MTLCGVRECWPQCESANAGIHLVFGHFNTDDNEIVLCHLLLPSLLGSGSKPLQLFGLRKNTGAVPCSDLRLCAFGASRAQFQRRAVLREPPVRTFWQILRTQGGGTAQNAVSGTAIQPGPARPAADD